MVLAAGRGERLRPLTDRTPKPLVEIGGATLLGRHLERLAAAGFRRAVINVAHLGEQIVQRFDGRAPLEVAWSREPEPLETAGGIAYARALLGEAPFLLVNADIWCDFDFSPLRGFPLGKRLAHLVLVPNPPWHPKGDFTLNLGEKHGAIGNGASPRYTYAGISVLSPALVDGVAAGSKAQLAPLWRAAAERGAVSGELYEGYWNDAGTHERLKDLKTRAEQP
jgi:MurNAc alpha-1-phosphate uridylyltransferase